MGKRYVDFLELWLFKHITRFPVEIRGTTDLGKGEAGGVRGKRGGSKKCTADRGSPLRE